MPLNPTDRAPVATGLRATSGRPAAVLLLLWALVGVPDFGAVGTAGAAAPAKPPKGLGDYVDGLDLLEAGKFADAAAKFQAALDADSDLADYHLAKGVALVLSEQFQPAGLHLQRARSLYGSGRNAWWQTRLWNAALLKMSDDPSKAANEYGSHPHGYNDYADLVYNRMAAEYWSSVKHGTVFDRVSGQHVRVSSPVRTHFAPAAATFAGIAKQNINPAAMVPHLAARARTRYVAGDHAGALEDIRNVLAAEPANHEALQLSAAARVAVRDAHVGRREFTRVLTTDPKNVSAYLGRAMAAAMMGDARRMQADLDVAHELDPATTTGYKPAVEAQIARFTDGPPPETPDVLLRQLREAVKAGEPLANRVVRAAALLRAVDAGRRRADESYQDELRVKTAAVARRPADPIAVAELGAFLFTESSVPFERLGPRSEGVPWRHQTAAGRAAEVREAERLLGRCVQLEDALAAEQKGVDHLRRGRVLITLAAVLVWEQRFAEARGYLFKCDGRVLRDDPKAIVMLSKLLLIESARREVLAGVVRGKAGINGDSAAGYWRPSQQQDANLAAGLDEAARELREFALGLLRQAAGDRADTAEGAYAAAVALRVEGKPAEARKAAENAVRLNPEWADAHRLLAAILWDLDEPMDAIFATAEATTLRHTTAVTLLGAAWREIERTAFGAAGKLLARAERAEPSDPRVSAFLGVLADAEGRHDDARLHFSVALALEDAALARRGIDPASDKPEASRAEPEAFGMSLLLRRKLGGQLIGAGKHAEAAEVFLSGVRLSRRIPSSLVWVELPTAMLPVPALEAGNVPQAPLVGELVAWMHTGAGTAMVRSGRHAEALRQFETVRQIVGNYPSTRDGRQRLQEPEVWANCGMARMLHAQGRFNEAAQIANRLGRPWGLAPSTEAELKAVQALVRNRGR